MHPTHSKRSGWLTALVLALLPLILFWRETLGLRTFYHHDIQYYFYAYHHVSAELLGSGQLPLWNPYAFSGIPLLGDGQTALFYPPSWLFLVLPTPHALTLNILLQFSIAGVGMHLYLRRLQLSTPAALLGAIAMMFNGFLIARIVHLSIMAGAALVPLIFWSIERLIQERRRRDLVLAAALVAIQAVAGHPQIPVYTALALGCYVGVLALLRWRSARGGALRMLLVLPTIYVLGYALAAIQLLPWVDFARLSPRAANASYEFIVADSIRWTDWLLMIFPYSPGGMRQTWMQTAPVWDLPIPLWERLGYVGLLPIGLAFIGVGDVRRRIRSARERGDDASYFTRDRIIALTILMAGMLIFAAGSSFPTSRLIYLLPVVGKLRAYARAIGVAVVPLTAMAAFGIQRLHERQARDRLPIAAAVFLLLIISVPLVVANAHLLPLEGPLRKVMFDRGLQLEQASAYVPLTLGLLSALLLGIAAVKPRRAVLLAMVLLTGFDLSSLALTFYPTTAPAVMEHVPASVTFLRQQEPELFRTASFIQDEKLPVPAVQSQLAISWAMVYQFEDVNGFNSLQPRRYTDVFYSPDVEDVSYGFLHDERLLQPGHTLLSMLDVHYALEQRSAPLGPPPAWPQVYQDELVTIYQNPQPYGRAWFVNTVEHEPDYATIVSKMKRPSFSPKNVAYVETPVAGIEQQTPGGSAQVRVERPSVDRLTIHTNTDRERFLVISEMWFPGWVAEIDGQPLPIERTNGIMRGLLVPEGSHTITMAYRPVSLTIGAIISGVALLMCAALIFSNRRAG